MVGKKVIEINIDNKAEAEHILERGMDRLFEDIRKEIREYLDECKSDEDIVDEMAYKYKIFQSWKKEFTPHDIGEAIRNATKTTMFNYGILKESFYSVMMDVFAELFPQEEFDELFGKAQKEEE